MTTRRARPAPAPAGGGSDPVPEPAPLALAAFAGGFRVEAFRASGRGVRLEAVGPGGALETLTLPVEALLPVSDMLRSATSTRPADGRRPRPLFVYGRVVE